MPDPCRHAPWARLRSPLAVLMTLMVLVGCSGAAERTAPEPQESSASGFDPLAFEEPTWEGPPAGRPTPREMAAALRYLADAYTYEMRTTFATKLSSMLPSDCLCSFARETEELREQGLRAEMDAVRLTVLDRSPIEGLPDRRQTWGAWFLVEWEMGERVILDADGEEVRVEPAESYVADVYLLADIGRFWFVSEWNKTTRTPGQATPGVPSEADRVAFVAPPTFGSLDRVDSPEIRAERVEDLKALRTRVEGVDSLVTGQYASPAGTVSLVFQGINAVPDSPFDDEIRSSAAATANNYLAGAGLEQRELVDAGPRGGAMVCAPFEEAGLDGHVCAWSTVGVLGVLTLIDVADIDEAAARTREFRGAAERAR